MMVCPAAHNTGEGDGVKEGRRIKKKKGKLKRSRSVYMEGDEEIRDIRGGVYFIRMQQEARRRNTLPPGREGRKEYAI